MGTWLPSFRLCVAAVGALGRVRKPVVGACLTATDKVRQRWVMMENVFWHVRVWLFVCFSPSVIVEQHSNQSLTALPETSLPGLRFAGCLQHSFPLCPVVSECQKFPCVVKQPHRLGWWLGWDSDFYQGLLTQSRWYGWWSGHWCWGLEHGTIVSPWVVCVFDGAAPHLA